jgi:hypothetical protein
MRRRSFVVLIVIGIALFHSYMNAQAPEKITEYVGMCDASAAVAVSKNMFIVANDEDNVLRIYKTDKTDEPVSTFDLASFLEPQPAGKEADLEGATLVGDRIYWISSHGNKKDGSSDPNRRRLFATDVKVEGDQVTITPVGAPYRDLVTDLAEAPTLKDFRLGQAAAAGKAPEDEGGLNIEGLCARKDGKMLLTGFRNPIPGGKALLVPLENPEEVVGRPKNERKTAKLGAPILLDLGGLGIRSIVFCDACDTYIIVAGPYNDGDDFKLYEWSGVT